mgnify:CR=1 FL=1
MADNCRHCGTSFSPAEPGEEFCCSGCAFVHRMIHDEGLEQFYSLKGTSKGRPVKDRPFQPRNLAWLIPLLEEAGNSEEAPPSITLRINGLTCVGCVWLIEKIYRRLPGARDIRVFPATGEAELSWEPGQDPVTSLARELPDFGYALAPLESDSSERRESRQLLARLGLCGAFALNAMGFTLPRYLGMANDFAFATIFELIALLSASFSILVGGTYFFRKSLASLRRRSLHIDLPISLGLILAFTGSLAGWLLGADDLLYFDFVAIFTFLMLGGRYLHLAAAERAQSSLRGQHALPATVELANGSRKAARALTKGDTFLLGPGESLPVTAFLEHGHGDFSLAWMTGEPDPQTFHSGRRIPSGALNLGNQALSLRADEAFTESMAAKLTAPGNREESSPLLGRVLKIYLATVLLIGVIGGVAWLAIGVVPALQVALSVFVVSCPCALGVAIPLADRRAALAVQDTGVFIQNPGVWARLRTLRNLVLDKTGTLTLERPALCNTGELKGLTTTAQRILHTLTSQSLHPLSRTLHEELSPMLVDSCSNLRAQVQETPGQGVHLELAHHRWSLERERTPRAGDEEGPVTCLYRDDELVARFTFEEQARADARESLECTTGRWQLTPYILSGDRSPRVARLAHALGLPEAQAHGDLDPTEKAAVVRSLGHTLYLGDGANDSLAFDEAQVTGTPVADRSLLDRKADFLFSHPGLAFLPTLLETAAWRHRTVSRVLTFAITYNLVAIGLCLAGLMNPLLAAVIMPLSSLCSLAIASGPLHRASASKRPKTLVLWNSEPQPA